MNGECFEIGAIQAFLDGETPPDTSLRLTIHVAACPECARLMADADEESSIVFSALERELNALVPTQRLWSRINETIEIEKSRTPIWQRAFAYVATSLANPSIAAAAGILLVLGMSALVITVRDNTGTDVADKPVSPGSSLQSSPSSEVAKTVSDNIISPAPPSVEISSLPPKKLEAIAMQANARSTQREIRPQTADYRTPIADTYLPGEETYVKTITDLNQNVDSQKDTVLTPSTRVSYERDMAVVNDSIKRMREVVNKNPRNQAARQVLYASYQDKIDLLNSVAQREELLASLR